MALRDARQEDVYRFEKNEGLERRFWCQLHHDFYMTVMLKGSEAPIVPCKYVDWPYFEKLNDHTTMPPWKYARSLDFMTSWASGTIGTLRSLHSSILPYTMMHIKSLSIGLLRERNMA